MRKLQTWLVCTFGLFCSLCVGLKLISSTDIEVDALTSSDHLFVKLHRLDDFSKQKRIDIINSINKKHKSFIHVKRTDEEVDIADKFSFKVIKDLNHTYAKGVVPL